MTKRTFSAVAGFLGLCLSLSAQQTNRPDIFSLNNSFLLPSLTLADRGFFSFSEPVAPPLSLNWMETTLPDSLSTLSATKPQRANASGTDGKDSSKEVVDMRRPSLLDSAHGEVGVLYGRSTGKHGFDLEQGYFSGEVGDDRFHITVGASYDNLTRRH
jgi:hypothetical protein